MIEERKAILIVDDNPGLRKSLSDILELKGFTAVGVSNGKKALENLREWDVSVALIDLQLPDMDGLMVLKAVKDQNPEVECIVLTGHASLSSAIEAVNLGAYGYVQKPYDVDHLLLTICRAIENQEAKEALKLSEESLALAIEASESGYFEYTTDYCTGHFSDRWAALLGYARQELPPLKGLLQWWEEQLHPEDVSRVQKVNDDLIKGRSDHYNIEYRIRHRNGNWLWIRQTSKSVIRDVRGRAKLVAGIVLDITKQKIKEKKLAFMATHDALTGLPNRPLFIDRLIQALAHAQRNKRKLAVIFLDLDGFKKVNDIMGHEMGDRLLKKVSGRLLSCLRKSDTVARLGGDEFILLLPEIRNDFDLHNIAEKIRVSVNQPFELDSRHFRVSVSIGITLYPEDGMDYKTLMNNADIAMYYAKNDGRNTFKRYHSDMHFHENSLRIEGSGKQDMVF